VHEVERGRCDDARQILKRVYQVMGSAGESGASAKEIAVVGGPRWPALQAWLTGLSRAHSGMANATEGRTSRCSRCFRNRLRPANHWNP